MSGAAPTSDLVAAAARLGIQTEYWDVDGGHHTASVDALLAVMTAMGVEHRGATDAPDAARRFALECLGVLSDPMVIWGDADLVGTVLVPPRPPASLRFVLDYEDGGRRVVDVATEALVPVGADPGADRDTDPDPLGPDGDRRQFRLPGPFPVGQHRVTVEIGAQQASADALVAPLTGAGLGARERLWGVFAPAYALPGGTGVGANVGDLDRLAAAVDRMGGKVVGTLPMLASWLGEPYDPSPYAPVSRRFWNELFVELAALPELAAVPVAADDLSGLRAFGHAANAKSRAFDYRHQYGYVRGVLEQVVAARRSWPAAWRRAFEDHVAARPEITTYARFRAYAERRGTGWHAWPEPQRSGTIGAADVDPEVVAFHEFAQYAMTRDIERLNDGLRDRGQRLYLDLPVGAHGDGYDTWLQRDLFAWGAGAGAPPDGFFTAGQNWGFPPLRPLGCGSELIRYFRDVVRHHCEVAGILRLDHVMGLHRMYWVPDGMDARDGLYVRYPREALFAALTLESRRSDCVVVGEDLGTVPDEIREAMHRHGLLGMSVAEFNQPAWAGAELVGPEADQLASIGTHDTPTFPAWLRGLDIDRRADMGLLDAGAAEAEHAERRQQVENLTGFLVARGELLGGGPADDPAAVLGAVLRHLGESEAPVVLVSLDDLAGETNPQNVPGTGVERPNWVQRLPFTLDELEADAGITEILAGLQGCRLGSHLRAEEQPA